MALVITLIMLSVITFMAVTFLVLSRRERNAAQSATDQSMARNAADSAQQRAQIELLGAMLAFTNDQVVGLIVSTNYVNRYGYDPTAPIPVSGSNPTNVNYFYEAVAGNPPLTLNHPLQNLANLLYNPRAPVFVTNRNPGSVGIDFPYYLDLNRNGIADTNGWWPVITNGSAVVINGVTNYSYFSGDPEWIGVLEHPDMPHSSSNKFVARYAYLVVPTSQTLDINYIHNYAALGAPPPSAFEFRRNMGMGSWEINLAGFLADLNTNIWGRALYSFPPFNPAYYEYLPLQSPNGVVNGVSFSDAQSLLNFRYGGGLTPWNNVKSVQGLFGASPGTTAIRTDLSDEYGGGQPYMTGTRLPTLDGDDTRYTSGWPGSDNPNHFFTPQDLFQVPGFGARLQSVRTNIDSYDRYTFYRLLSQLGSDSAPDQNKMNLNYRNMANGIVVAGMETNFIPWRPLDFFTNAARKIFGQLRLPDPTAPNNPSRWIDVDNIPVYPINAYSPAVHRVLQLAANMYDATTSTNTPYPSIFRPVFTKRNANDIVITGYELVNAPEDTATLPGFLSIPLDLLDPAERANIVSSPPGCNVYGLPWIIGAKKGFPNLNKVGMQTITTLSRRLLATNTAPAGSGLSRIRFTQMIEVGISNVIGVQMWNSYSNAYPRPVFVQADGALTMLLSNIDNGFRYPSAPVKMPIGAPGYVTNFLGTGWVPTVPGRDRPPNARSFQIPLLTNFVFVPWAQYRQVNPGFFQVPANQTLNWGLNAQNSFPQPHWILSVTNRLRCMIIDGGPGGRVIDYVQLSGLDSVRDLSADSTTDDRFNMFKTNMATFGSLNMPEGVQRQIMMALGNPPGVDQATWANYGGVGNVSDEIQKFKDFVYGNHQGNPAPIPPAQVPFTPTARQYQTLNWQANDPLVHYLASDLFFAPVSNSNPTISGFVIRPLTNDFYTWNQRYDPWNGRPSGTPQSDPYAWDMSVKDPSVWSSDFWDFPTNKFPSIGWLGRVHRGTPWQTVYMKSTDTTRTNLPAWRDWSGTPNDVLAQRSAPVNDWGLFDLFTTSINDNASRGRLSANQTGLAAWSAVFSGVITLTNSGPVPEPAVIDPAGPFDPNLPSPVARIVQGINNARFFTNLVGAPVFRNHVFNHAGDVLATPELTEASPFLNTTNLHSNAAGGITDEIMERIPQQIMSLLTLNHSPRFVIYSYGQTLRPADRSLYMNSGPFFRMCTNYQVTAETATRAVVRVEGSFDPGNRPLSQSDPTARGPDSFGRLFPPHIVVEQFNVLPPD